MMRHTVWALHVLRCFPGHDRNPCKMNDSEHRWDLLFQYIQLCMCLLLLFLFICRHHCVSERASCGQLFLLRLMRSQFMKDISASSSKKNILIFPPHSSSSCFIPHFLHLEAHLQSIDTSFINCVAKHCHLSLSSNSAFLLHKCRNTHALTGSSSSHPSTKWFSRLSQCLYCVCCPLCPSPSWALTSLPTMKSSDCPLIFLGLLVVLGPHCLPWVP